MNTTAQELGRRPDPQERRPAAPAVAPTAAKATEQAAPNHVDHADRADHADATPSLREHVASLMRHNEGSDRAQELLAELAWQRRTELLVAGDPEIQAELAAVAALPAPGAALPPAGGGKGAVYRLCQPDATLPGAPAVYQDLLDAAVLADPARLERLLEPRAGFSALLGGLGAAADPGRPRPAMSARESCAVLGAQCAFAVAGLLVLLAEAPQPPAGYPEAAAMYRHCLGAGLAAVHVARACRLPEPERFFACGFLHDAGRLAMLLNRPGAAAAAMEGARARGSLLHEVEPEHFGHGHASAGAELLRGFRVPEVVRKAVLYHHIPELSDQVQANAVVHVADALAHALALGSSGELLVPPLRPVAFAALGLDPSELAHLADQVLTAFYDSPGAAGNPFPGATEEPFEFY